MSVVYAEHFPLEENKQKNDHNKPSWIIDFIRMHVFEYVSITSP